MAKKEEDPEVLRLVVGFLRFFVDQTQTEFAEASGLSQGVISLYESGLQKPREKSLRRMAAVASVPWDVVGHLRRFYSAMLPAIREGRANVAQLGEDRLERAVLEPALLALASYWAEEEASAAAEEERRQSPAELRRAAEQTWEALARFPVGRRRQVAELLPPSCRTRELAVRVCEASLQAAANSPEEAMELTQLALEMAPRVIAEIETARRSASPPGGRESRG